jgi:hypothetical protein
MVKHTSKEAYFERLKNLADVNRPSLKESQIRNLGSLIDYKRAADGVAYGIVKENHSYFLKIGGTKQDPNVSDFAYIGGLGNITNFKYKSLSEADKQRNMIFHTINEAVSLRPDKNGSKKKKLNEDVASDEINKAAEKVGDLDTAASAEAEPALDTDGGAEMTAGLEAKPEGDAEETPEPAPEETPEPAPEGPEGGEEVPAEEPSTEEVPAEEKPEGDGEENVAASTDGDIDEPNKEIEKAIGKLTNKIRKTEMEDAQVKSYINSFLVAFKDKLRDIDVEDRKEMADKLLNVLGQEEIEDLGDSIPQENPDSELGPESGLKPEGGVEEEQCAECGSFARYAESRGYSTAQSLMECGEEEVGNLVSGYANAHNDGMNDGDLENVALIVKVVNPEILNQLKGDYGHEDYANKLTPYVDGMNECSEEENVTKLNELFGGLKGAFGKVSGDIKAGAQKAGQAVGGAIKKGAQAVGNVAKAGAEKVGQYATGVKQAYHAGEVPGEVKKLEGIAASLGKQVAALNTRLTKAGQQPVNVNSILQSITNQLGAGSTASLGKYSAVAETTDPANVPVQPDMLKEEDDELEKPEGVETDSPEHEAGETPAEEKAEHEPGGEEFNVEEPFVKSGDKPLSFGPESQSLGLSSIKPDGAGVEIVVEPDKTVNINMNESEKKLRKYIRNRLEEKAGLRKPNLNESKKSPTLKKLDGVIDQQYKLYESVVAKKKGKIAESAVNEILGFSVADKFTKLNPNDEAGVNALFQSAFKNILINPKMSVIGTAANRATTQEKYALLQQYVAGGGGTLRLDKTGKLIYASKEFQEKGTPRALSTNYGAITK